MLKKLLDDKQKAVEVADPTEFSAQWTVTAGDDGQLEELYWKGPAEDIINFNLIILNFF